MTQHQQTLINTILAATYELAESLEQVPDVPSSPVPSDSLTVGGVKFPVIRSPEHNLYVVDPRPLLAASYEWQVYDHSNDLSADGNAAIRKIGTLRWEHETTHKGMFPNALHFGRWRADVELFPAGAKWIVSAYYIEDSWLLLYQAGLRDKDRVGTPLITSDPHFGNIKNEYGPYRLPLKEMRISPSCETHGAYILEEFPLPHHKSDAFPMIWKNQRIPCLSFEAGWKSENVVSEGILQLT